MNFAMISGWGYMRASIIWRDEGFWYGARPGVGTAGRSVRDS